MSQSIEVEFDLPHPPEKVWRALTDTGLIARWLMENDFRPVVGHAFGFLAEPIPGQWDGKVACVVLAVERPKLLRYSWKGGQGDDALDTTVTWTLEPTTNGTRLHLSHAGFTDKNRFAFENMGKGWRGHLARRMGEVLSTL